MTAKNKLVSDEELLEMHRAGKPVRSIAAALKKRGTPLSPSTIDERLARLAAAGEPVRGKSKRTVPLKPITLEAPPDEGDDIDATRNRLRRVRALLTANETAVMAGEVSMSSWAGLARLEADLVDRVVSQIVPAPPRPEDDPINLEAAAAFVAKLETAVRAAEQNARCSHCGKPPFKS